MESIEKNKHIKKPIPTPRFKEHIETNLQNENTNDKDENREDNNTYENVENLVKFRKNVSNKGHSLHRSYTVEEIRIGSYTDTDIKYVGSTPVRLRSKSVTEAENKKENQEKEEDETNKNAIEVFPIKFTSHTKQIDKIVEETRKKINICSDKMNSAPLNEDSYREVKESLLQSRDEIKLAKVYNKKQETRMALETDFIDSLLHHLDEQYSKIVLTEPK